MQPSPWVYPERAQNRAKQRLLNPAICTDDFGNIVYKCHYSGVYTGADAILLGPMLPTVAGAYVCSTEAKNAYKTERASFDASEANCNTCKNLVRAIQAKSKDGIMTGSCKEKNLYTIRFHPDDPMRMDCWKPRDDQK